MLALIVVFIERIDAISCWFSCIDCVNRRNSCNSSSKPSAISIAKAAAVDNSLTCCSEASTLGPYQYLRIYLTGVCRH